MTESAPASPGDRRLAGASLIDTAFDAYLDWRDACASVRHTYERWREAAPRDAPATFRGYREALEREEQAACIYAGVVGRITAACRAPGRPARSARAR